MKVLHVVYTFAPDAPGGTELYVEGLCRALRERGIENAVAAPSAEDASYERDGLPVRRFAVDDTPSRLSRVYGVDAAASKSFAQILERERPDVVHQHAVSSACSHDLIRQAKALGIPVVFTYHTPAVTCLRGTLLYQGRDRCDGRLDVQRCTACTLEGLGVNGAVVRMLGGVPDAVGQFAGRLGLEGGVWTALRMPELVRMRHEVARGVLDGADLIVSLAPWVTELLRLNGVPSQKIVESAHGIQFQKRSGPGTSRQPSDQIRIAHLGRVDPVKGTKLLIEAMRSASDATISLDIFGIVQNEGSRRLLEELETLARPDRRIRFHPPIAPADVTTRLAEYDFVAVPSQWLETGPLVVLEAFAAGVPVIGSDLGGIADKVRTGINGVLVRPPHAVDAWAAALRSCAAGAHVVDGLRKGVQPPRSMSEVADDMQRIYGRLTLSAQGRSQPAREAAAV